MSRHQMSQLSRKHPGVTFWTRVQISALVGWLKSHCFHQFLRTNIETLPQERSELWPSTSFQKYYALIILSFVASCWSACCMEFGWLSPLPVNAHHREVVSVVTAFCLQKHNGDIEPHVCSVYWWSLFQFSTHVKSHNNCYWSAGNSLSIHKAPLHNIKVGMLWA